MAVKFLLVSTIVLVTSSCHLTSSPKEENKFEELGVVVEDSIATTLSIVEEDEMPTKKESSYVGKNQTFNLINYIKREYIDEERANVVTYDSIKVSLKVKSNLSDVNNSEKPGFHNLVIDCVSASEPRSYSLDDSFDMGEFDLWFFKGEESNVIIVEFYDYYSSVFVAYALVDERLFRIGHFVVREPDVEEIGIQKKEIKVELDGEKYIVTTFLGGVKDGVFEFYTKDSIEQTRLD